MLLLSTVGQIFLCELDLKALGHFSEAAVHQGHRRVLIDKIPIQTLATF
jgi:hypothetical protein